MKSIIFVTLITLAALANCQTHLRTGQNHQGLPFLNNMNPLQIASLLSGDFVSILPASIQPIVRSVLGQQQQSGVSGFLNQAQNILGGGGKTGGLLGGMGNLFGQASQQGQNGLGNFLGGITNSFGGSSNSGISSLLGLPNLSGLNLNNVPQNPSGFSSILNTFGVNQ